MQLHKVLAIASLILIIIVGVEVYFYITLKNLPIQKKTSQNTTAEKPLRETPYHTSLKSFVANASDYIEKPQSFKKNMYSVMRYSGTVTKVSLNTSNKTISIELSDGSGDTIAEYRSFPTSIIRIYRTSQNDNRLVTIDDLVEGSVADVREYTSVYAPGKPNELFIELHLLNEPKK